MTPAKPPEVVVCEFISLGRDSTNRKAKGRNLRRNLIGPPPQIRIEQFRNRRHSSYPRFAEYRFNWSCSGTDLRLHTRDNNSPFVLFVKWARAPRVVS